MKMFKPTINEFEMIFVRGSKFMPMESFQKKVRRATIGVLNRNPHLELDDIIYNHTGMRYRATITFKRKKEGDYQK